MLKKLSFYDLKACAGKRPGFFQEFLEEITVNVTEMFRDPAFYKALKQPGGALSFTYQHIQNMVCGLLIGRRSLFAGYIAEREPAKQKIIHLRYRYQYRGT
jgi:chemotaxis protein methyltransferase CheR